MYTVLITCVGGDMAPQMIQELKNSKRHQVRVVGVDANDNAIGRYFCDEFAIVPYGNDLKYGESIQKLVDLHNIDLIIPTSDEESIALASLKPNLENSGCALACIDSNVLEVLTNKAKTYQFLKNHGVHTPKTQVVENFEYLKRVVNSMYEEFGECVIKPACARGGRGVYVISSKYVKTKFFDDRREVHLDLDSFLNSLMYGLENDFPLVVMERLSEPVIDLDLLGWQGKDIRIIPRRRVNSAVPNDGHIIFDNASLIDLGKKLINIFELSWLYDCDIMFDSKGNPCVLELNPRQSGSVAVSLCAGIPLLDDVISLAKGETGSIPEIETPFGARIIPYKSLILRNA